MYTPENPLCIRCPCPVYSGVHALGASPARRICRRFTPPDDIAPVAANYPALARSRRDPYPTLEAFSPRLVAFFKDTQSRTERTRP